MKKDEIIWMMIVLLFLLALIGLVFSFKGVITGYAVFYSESNLSLDVNYSVSTNSSYILDIEGIIMDFKLSGAYSLDSDILVYLNADSDKYLVFDSSLDQGLREYLDRDDSLVDVNFNLSSDEIGIVMDYSSNPSPQRYDSLIDFTVNRSSFDLDESKVCTKWNVDNSSYICNGAASCCLFLDREPYQVSWDAPFGVVSSGVLDRTVYASIHYIDYNLSVPYVNISSSLNASLDAVFFDDYVFSMEGISNLEEKGDYSLEFVVNSGSIDVNRIDYSVLGSLGALDVSGINSNLSLSWDDALGFSTPYVLHNLTLTANYSSLSAGISGATCNITYSNGGFAVMSYAANLYYDYNVFNTSGNYSYNVSCNANGYDYLNDTRNITIELPVAGFSDSGNSFTSVKESSLAFADYDNDGDWDLVISGDDGSNKVSKFYNNNLGTFTADTGYTIEDFDLGSMSFGDIDRDGDLDLVAMGDNGTQFSIVYLNNGSAMNKFQELTGMDQGSNMLADIDNDGDLDLGRSGSTDGSSSGVNSSIYYYNGSFTHSIDLNGLFQSSIAIGELNNNSKLDLLLSGSTESSDGTYIFNQSNTFVNVQNLSGQRKTSISLADFDNDNKIDLFISGSTSSTVGNGKTYIYQNNGTDFNLFSVLNGTRDGSLTVGDFNNDGLIDLIVTGKHTSNQNIIEFYTNDGTNFTYVGTQDLTGIFQSSVSLFDYDSDGDLDLAISGSDGSNAITKIYNNNVSLITNNTKPNVPTSFNNSFNDGWFNISWNNGSDDLTPKLGLYYNLRIGTAPNGNDVVSGKYGGSSNPTQGYLGNMQQRKQIAINVTTEQTYYWQVQTIDSGLKSSEWSAVQTYEPSDCLVPAGDWLVNATCTKSNQVIYVNGSINITGSLKLINTTLIINAVSKNIYVQGGTLNISNSIINASGTNYYNLDVNGSSTFDMDNSTIEKAFTVNIRNSDIELTNNVISNQDYGINLSGTNISIIDSTISGSTIDIANNGSNNNLTNVTFSTKSVSSGSLYVNYYLDTTVTDDGSAAVSSVNVTAYDNNTNIIANGLTDGNGYLRLTLMSYVSNTSDYSYNNYTLSYTKNLLVPINRSRNITDNLVLAVTMDTSDLPITTGFDSELTTDFSLVSDLENVSGAKIGKLNLGVISWLENVNVTGLNLTNLIQITKNYISLDSSVRGINKSANISLFNLSYAQTPVVLKDNSICSDCVILNYSNTNLTFNVSGFSVYNATSNSQLTASSSNRMDNRPLVDQSIWFIANYTNRTSGLAINGSGVNCSIVFNDIGPNNMSFNTTTLIYEFNRTFSSEGSFNYNVSCDGDAMNYENISLSSSVTTKLNQTYLILNQSLVEAYRGSLVIGNLRNDNSIDLLISGTNTTRNTYFFNNINNSFNLNTSYNFTGLEKGANALIDYDNDGDLDILLVGMGSNEVSYSKFHRND